jgi:hypothetical protein
MATELYFALPSALRLAEHALASPANLPSLSEQDDGASCTGALEWVADDGTYLMSNGTPALLSDPHDPTSNIVVHAEGWGPCRCREPRPRRSRGMLVLMEDAAEAIASADVELDEPVRFDDRFG